MHFLRVPDRLFWVLDAFFRGSGPPKNGFSMRFSQFLLINLRYVLQLKLRVKNTRLVFPPKTFRFANFSLFFGCAKLELNTIADASRGTTII